MYKIIKHFLLLGYDIKLSPLEPMASLDDGFIICFWSPNRYYTEIIFEYQFFDKIDNDEILEFVIKSVKQSEQNLLNNAKNINL